MAGTFRISFNTMYKEYFFTLAYADDIFLIFVRGRSSNNRDALCIIEKWIQENLLIIPNDKCSVLIYGNPKIRKRPSIFKIFKGNLEKSERAHILGHNSGHTLVFIFTLKKNRL